MLRPCLTGRWFKAKLVRVQSCCCRGRSSYSFQTRNNSFSMTRQRASSDRPGAVLWRQSVIYGGSWICHGAGARCLARIGPIDQYGIYGILPVEIVNYNNGLSIVQTPSPTVYPGRFPSLPRRISPQHQFSRLAELRYPGICSGIALPRSGLSDIRAACADSVGDWIRLFRPVPDVVLYRRQFR